MCFRLYFDIMHDLALCGERIYAQLTTHNLPRVNAPNSSTYTSGGANLEPTRRCGYSKLIPQTVEVAMTYCRKLNEVYEMMASRAETTLEHLSKSKHRLGACCQLRCNATRPQVQAMMPELKLWPPLVRRLALDGALKRKLDLLPRTRAVDGFPTFLRHHISFSLLVYDVIEHDFPN